MFNLAPTKMQREGQRVSTAGKSGEQSHLAMVHCPQFPHTKHRALMA